MSELGAIISVDKLGTRKYIHEWARTMDQG